MFIIYILTSSNVKLARIAYNSCINQLNHNINYSICINVNSLNDDYYKTVLEEFMPEITSGKLYNIIKTTSNGLPGLGHQSCVNQFNYTDTQFKYCMILDGDDLYYPSCFHQINKVFNEKGEIDILMIQANEKINFNTTEIPLNNNLYLHSFDNHKYNLWHGIQFNNPVKTHINNCGTLLRLLCFHRNILNDYNELFFTTAKLHDDFLTFLVFTDIVHKNKYKGLIIPCNSIYLYNAINDDSITYKSKKYEYDYDDKLVKMYSDKYHILQNWDLMSLPFYQLSPPDWFNYKIQFCNNFIHNYINTLKIQYNNLIQSNSFNNELINIILKLNKLNINNTDCINNLAISYYNLGYIKKSLEILINSLSHYNSIDNIIENIIKISKKHNINNNEIIKQNIDKIEDYKSIIKLLSF